MGTDDIIKIENLNFSYSNSETGESTEVLKNINLNVRRGEFVAVLGHNGSGKSTLAKLMNAILTPTSGRVLADGIDTSDESRLFDIRSRVGMVFQNPDNQLVTTIVEEDVAFAPENMGVPPAEIRKRVDYALKTVGMYEFRRSAPHHLSGGQKQRVAIAGVLAMMPDVIVLDEPTAMLDPSGRREIMDTVSRLNRDEGMTVILITHYMDEAVRADRVVVISDGEIVRDAPPREVFSQVDELKKIGLDVPQSTELAYLLSKDGFDIKTDVLNAEECTSEIERLLMQTGK